MNKLIPFSKYVKAKMAVIDPANISVVVDEKNTPLGFVFGREAFITFLEKMDSEFEKKVKDVKKAYDNPAGNLIDLIEEHLPLRQEFITHVRDAESEAKRKGWIPFDDVVKALHV